MMAITGLFTSNSKGSLRKAASRCFALCMDLFVQQGVRRRHRRVFWGDGMLLLDRSAGFLDDPEFAAAFGPVSRSASYGSVYASPQGIAWRLHTLVWAAEHAKTLPGDFVECGVYKGEMSDVVTRVVNFGESAKTFYLYDTFGGFSEKYSAATDFPDAPAFFKKADEMYREEGLFESVKKRFAQLPNVRVIQGVVPDIFAEASPEQIAYLHIDLNSAGAEIGALESLFDRVVPGGIIVLDDYGRFPYRKQKEAEDTFFAARGYMVMELPTGQGMVVKR